MLITLCCLFSFTSYSIFSYNKTLKKEISPFLFLGILFSLFFIEFIGLYGLNIHYSTFFILDIFLISTLCAFFYIFFIKKIFNNRFDKEFWKKLGNSYLHNLVYLFIMIFFITFLLFFHLNSEIINSDNIFYQALSMHYLSIKSNTFSSFIINNNYSSLSYSIVGYYSFLASLGLKQVLLNYPYFNMFLYFYLIFSTVYYINMKFIKTSWINILLYLCIFSFVFLIYFYASKSLGYLLYGNYTSSFFFGLLIIPSLFTTKNRSFHYKYIIPLLLLSMLFYNETAILCGVVYLITYFIFLLFIKKKVNGLFITLPTILCLVINLYLWFCYYIANKKNLYQSELLVFKLLPLLVFLTIFLIICVILLDLLKNINFKYSKYFSIYMKLNKIFIIPEIKLTNTNWFCLLQKKNRIKLTKVIIGFIITCLFVCLMWFGNWKILFEMHDDLLTKNWIIIGSIIFFFAFYISFLFLNQNFFFNFYVLLVFTSFIIFFITAFLDNNAFKSGILYRLIFASITMIPFLNVATVYLYVSTILYTFIIIIINRQIKKYNIDSINQNSKLYIKNKFFKVISMTSITSCAILSSILTPSLMNINKNSLLTFSNIQTNFYGKMSINTVYQLSKFNFNNKLTFATIPLPIINQTSTFNIKYMYFMYYWTINSFINNIEAKHYITQPAFINPKTKEYFNEISNKNWENDILPYYKYLVIRTFNKKFLNFIYDINKNKITDFKLVKNINNQLFIFDNENYNQIKDNIFYKYNNNKFL